LISAWKYQLQQKGIDAADIEKFVALSAKIQKKAAMKA
jgi:SOS response regulatory protein OraA/RecX